MLAFTSLLLSVPFTTAAPGPPQLAFSLNLLMYLERIVVENPGSSGHLRNIYIHTHTHIYIHTYKDDSWQIPQTDNCVSCEVLILWVKTSLTSDQWSLQQAKLRI